MRDGVVAKQGGGNARGRRRVLVGPSGTPPAPSDLVGRENVLVQARPEGSSAPAMACICVSCALACGSRPTGRPPAPRCSRPAAPMLTTLGNLLLAGAWPRPASW